MDSGLFKAKRYGRGLGSGRGKRSGRGNKGWKARHGAATPGPPAFEGGQTNFIKTAPKHGYRLGRKDRRYAPLNLARLQKWIDDGRIDPNQPITARELNRTRCIHGVYDGVKLLGDGASSFTHQVKITVARASLSAIARVEKLGGTVTSEYRNRIGMQALLNPEKFAVEPRPKMPRDPRDVAYYTSPQKRGNLVMVLNEERGTYTLKRKEQ
ncbi:YmL10 [Gonapodya sp. JEL0774]|nr:YmL10 [Gonapodya sp. JEL0774]